ncbi:hypothetical protein COT52_00710 [candidate division WWE3 bacterium CG08_land_8_20_14_0_20_43_13]|uniref:PPM-type phosphatase domain-containing protein n=1 Tax=candidate division WWE3 bacterium CG08_land_8_20_14_0_20_43_13 TaxID=1975087 RepID=A0A2H0XAB3_UNCKA|nr:MAG: hypothetical protein COT52_00710 [candidate division WWE3 bacterium CG08_land_8_20_14_0_20_43_13]
MRKLLRYKSQIFLSSADSEGKSFACCQEHPPDDKNADLSKGTLFVVAEGWAGQKFDCKVVSGLINDTLVKNYYHDNNQPPLIALEQALLNLRQTMFDYISDSPELKSSNFSFNVTAGVLWNQIFYICLLGEGLGLIIKESGLSEIVPRSDSYLTSASGQIVSNEAVLLGSGGFFNSDWRKLAHNGLGEIPSLFLRKAPRQIGALLIKFEWAEVLDRHNALILSKAKSFPGGFLNVCFWLNNLWKKLNFFSFRAKKFKGLRPSRCRNRSRRLRWLLLPLVAAFLALGIWAVARRRQLWRSGLVEDFLRESEKVLNQARDLIGVNNQQAGQLAQEQLEILSTVLGAASSNQSLLQRQKELEEIKDRSFGIWRISDPGLFSSLPSDLSFGRLFGNQTDVYVADQGRGFLHRFDLANGLMLDQKEKDSAQLALFVCSPKKCWLFGQDSWQLADLEKDLYQKIANDSLFSYSDLTDGAFYDGGGEFVYLLSPVSNQVYKGLFDQEDGEFTYFNEWFNEDYDLSQAVSLAVDGGIYIGYSSGSVDYFYSGVKQDFSLKNTPSDYALLASLFTGVDYGYLYILDDKVKRVLVFSKEGYYQRQFVLGVADTLLDLWINQSQDRAFVLTQKRILSFPLAF